MDETQSVTRSTTLCYDMFCLYKSREYSNVRSPVLSIIYLCKSLIIQYTSFILYFFIISPCNPHLTPSVVIYFIYPFRINFSTVNSTLDFVFLSHDTYRSPFIKVRFLFRSYFWDLPYSNYTNSLSLFRSHRPHLDYPPSFSITSLTNCYPCVISFFFSSLNNSPV